MKPSRLMQSSASRRRPASACCTACASVPSNSGRFGKPVSGSFSDSADNERRAWIRAALACRCRCSTTRSPASNPVASSATSAAKTLPGTSTGAAGGASVTAIATRCWPSSIAHPRTAPAPARPHRMARWSMSRNAPNTLNATWQPATQAPQASSSGTAPDSTPGYRPAGSALTAPKICNASSAEPRPAASTHAGTQGRGPPALLTAEDGVPAASTANAPMLVQTASSPITCSTQKACRNDWADGWVDAEMPCTDQMPAARLRPAPNARKHRARRFAAAASAAQANACVDAPMAMTRLTKAHKRALNPGARGATIGASSRGVGAATLRRAGSNGNMGHAGDIDLCRADLNRSVCILPAARGTPLSCTPPRPLHTRGPRPQTACRVIRSAVRPNGNGSDGAASAEAVFRRSSNHLEFP